MADENDDTFSEEDEALIETTAASAPPVDFAAGADEPGLSAPSLASVLRRHNLDIDEDADDKDIISRFNELETAYEERERLRQENEQYRTMLARQQQQEHPAPKAEENPPEPAKPKTPEVPDWDESWEGWLTQDERGHVVVRQEYRGAVDPSLPEKYMKYKRWERDRLKQLLRQESSFDPTSLDGKFQEVEERAYKRALEEFQKTQQQSATRSYLDQYQQQNADWLQDPEMYRLMNSTVSTFLERGFSAEEAVKYGQMEVQHATGKTPWAKQDEESPTPPPTPVQRRVNLRAKAKTNGHSPIPQTPVPKREAMTQNASAPKSVKQLKNRYVAAFNEAAE